MMQLLAKFAIIFSSVLIRYLFIAGIAFLLAYKILTHKLESARIQKRQGKRVDFLREIRFSISSSFIFSVISLILYATPLKQYTLVYKNLNDYPYWWIPVSLILSLVIHDAYFYWMHRALHNKFVYRYAHLLHHKSISPSPFAAYSFHLFESVTEGMILPILAFCLPMHLITVILFITVSLMINVYGHLGFEIMPRRFRNSAWFEILNTSVYHNLHHSKFKGNYGLYLRIWDRLCGTEHPDYVKEYDRVQAQRFPAGNSIEETFAYGESKL
jgi:sterol desaturase/sphingolipid hydroxylase (fatty acid hydroxylase superfamily)